MTTESTFFKAATLADVDIANYPFTTLVPQLGIVQYRDDRSFVMADIPGIIEGASEGKGLGIRFLRHIERNSLLLFTVPADSNNIREEYSILLSELGRYSPELLDKKRILAVTKADLLDEELKGEIREDMPEVPWQFISSFSGEGIDPLKDRLWKSLNE